MLNIFIIDFNNLRKLLNKFKYSIDPHVLYEKCVFKVKVLKRKTISVFSQ